MRGALEGIVQRWNAEADDIEEQEGEHADEEAQTTINVLRDCAAEADKRQRAPDDLICHPWTDHPIR